MKQRCLCTTAAHDKQAAAENTRPVRRRRIEHHRRSSTDARAPAKLVVVVGRSVVYTTLCIVVWVVKRGNVATGLEKSAPSISTRCPSNDHPTGGRITVVNWMCV